MNEQNIQQRYITQAEKQIRDRILVSGESEQQDQENINMMTQQIQNNSSILKTKIQISKLRIDDLKLTLFLDKSKDKIIVIEDFLTKPLNIRKVIKQLSIYGHYTICFQICARLQFYHHIQDYFVVSLWAEHYNRITGWQFNNRQWKRKWTLLKNRGQQKIFEKVNEQQQRINFKALQRIKNKQNPHIINNLVQNLILCGFYQNCLVFFDNKRQFYRFFIKNQELIKIINQQFLIKANNYEIKFMEIHNWWNELQLKQDIFCYQYIFSLYQTKISNRTLQRYGQKFIQLSKEQQIKVKQEAIFKQQKFKDIVQQQKAKILIKVIYWSILRQKLQKLIQIEESIKQQEEQVIYDQQQIIKNIKNCIYDKKQRNKQLQKKIQQIYKKIKFNSQISYLEKQKKYKQQQLKVNFLSLHQINKQLEKAESNLDNSYEKLQFIICKLQGMKFKLKNINNQIGKCTKNMQFVQTKISKYDINNIFYRKLYKNKLQSKICSQTKRLFQSIKFPYTSSFIKQFYQFQFTHYGIKQINKILQFSQYEQFDDVFICDICIFAICLVLKHDRLIKSLDIISDIPNALRLIKKNKNYNIQISEHQ